MTYIPEAIRKLVYERAKGRCEYCLLPDQISIYGHEIDHIYAEKHGGKTEESNLCFCCFECNHHKSSEIASIDFETDTAVALFHPRRDVWSEHFRLNGGFIEALTPMGRVTVRSLQMNIPKRVKRRNELIELGLYPRN